MEDTNQKKSSRRFSFQTSALSPAVRIVLVVVAILVGIYFAIGFIIMSLAFIALFSAIRNLFALDVFSAIVSVVTYIGPVIFYLVLCILSCIFAKRFLKKQPISWKLLIAFAIFFVLCMVFRGLLTMALQLITVNIRGN